MRWCARAGGLLALAGLAAGCGGPSPVKVSGVLTIGGKPAEGVSVSFQPEDGRGKQAYANTAADGTFELTTVNPGDGAMPGSYRVVVTYHAPYEPDAPTAGMKAMMGGQAPPKRGTKPKYVIPPQYGGVTKTPFKQTVPPNGPVKLDIP